MRSVVPSIDATAAPVSGFPSALSRSVPAFARLSLTSCGTRKPYGDQLAKSALICANDGLVRTIGSPPLAGIVTTVGTVWLPPLTDIT